MTLNHALLLLIALLFASFGALLHVFADYTSTARRYSPRRYKVQLTVAATLPLIGLATLAHI